ncbi:hypothetical protein RFI_10158 [Reticulomyxa filosa]|uniref:Cilia- and flagella-associated protein 206 n=1 Tax=Reticulomyxa filosa TaxID=46433 RepID=X6NLV4_RETFI|nr:hypothetical protein RFI_10158 [Reticulomyxa filosa]|eukprot:ETO26976.1 hypothetical protein RFI_10158 [Reticulomyxa filosa]
MEYCVFQLSRQLSNQITAGKKGDPENNAINGTLSLIVLISTLAKVLLKKDEVETILGECCQLMLSNKNPKWENLKMQSQVNVRSQALRQHAKLARTQFEQFQKKCFAEIIEKPLHTNDKINEVTVKLVDMLCFQHKFTEAIDKIDISIERDIRVALEEVMRSSSIDHFKLLDPPSKCNFLLNILNTAYGVRLYRKCAKTGGLGISDKLIELRDLTNDQIHWVQKRVRLYYDVINYKVLSPESLNTSFERLKDELNNRCQYLQYNQILFDECHQAIDHVEAIHKKYLLELDKLTYNLQNEFSKLPNDAMASFANLSIYWSELAEEKRIHQLRKKLCAVVKRFECSYDACLKYAEIELSLSHKGFMESKPLATVQKEGNKCIDNGHVEQGSSTNAKDDNKYEWNEFSTNQFYYCNGFCPVTLIEKRGLLFFGKQGYVAEHQGRKMLCHSSERLSKVTENPSKFVFFFFKKKKKKSVTPNKVLQQKKKKKIIINK